MKMKNIKRWIVLLLVLTLFATISTGCGGKPESTAAATGENSSTTESPAAISGENSSTPSSNSSTEELFAFNMATPMMSDPIYIADAKGFLAEEGLKVNFTGAITSTQMLQALSNGSNDFGAGHELGAILAIGNGFKIKGIAAGWASTVENPTMGWLVLADSPYQSIQDIVGTTIGGTTTSPVWLEYLEKNGISQDSFTSVSVDGHDKVEQLLRTGDISTGSTLNPYYARAIESGEFRELFNYVDAVGEEGGWPQQWVNTDFLAAHPDIVRKYVSALAKACDWAIENPTEAGEIFAKALGSPPEFAKYYAAAFPPHALVDEVNAQLWLGLQEKYGNIEPGKVKTSDIYTNEYNPYYQK